MADRDNLDAWYAENHREPYEFQWAGQSWSLPHFSEIDWRAAGLAGDMMGAAEGASAETVSVDIDLIRNLFKYAFDAEQAERWEQVQQPAPVMIRLFTRWQQHGGADVGESSASSGSSASTEGPSNPTSPATTESGSDAPSTAAQPSGTAPANSST